MIVVSLDYGNLSPLADVGSDPMNGLGMAGRANDCLTADAFQPIDRDVTPRLLGKVHRIMKLSEGRAHKNISIAFKCGGQYEARTEGVSSDVFDHRDQSFQPTIGISFL